MQTISNLAHAILLSLLLGASAHAADKVNINTADAATIDEALVNIGPSKAQAIVDYRKANGPFRSAEQLAQVKGIGLKTVEKNIDRIVFGGAGVATKAVKPGTKPVLTRPASAKPAPAAR